MSITEILLPIIVKRHQKTQYVLYKREETVIKKNTQKNVSACLADKKMIFLEICKADEYI